MINDYFMWIIVSFAFYLSFLWFIFLKWCFVSGLSLKSQELTAIFLGARLYCSYVMEYDVHTLLDLATLTTTIWVIYMMRINLNSSYMLEKDNVSVLYVVSSMSILWLRRFISYSDVVSRFRLKPFKKTTVYICIQ